MNSANRKSPNKPYGSSKGQKPTLYTHINPQEIKYPCKFPDHIGGQDNDDPLESFKNPIPSMALSPIRPAHPIYIPSSPEAFVPEDPQVSIKPTIVTSSK